MDSDSEANQIADQDSVITQNSENVEDEAFHSEDPPIPSYASGKKTVAFDENRNQINERPLNESEYSGSASSLVVGAEWQRGVDARLALQQVFEPEEFVTSSPIKQDVYFENSTIYDNPMNSPQMSRRLDADYSYTVPFYQNDESRDSSPTKTYTGASLGDDIPVLAHGSLQPEDQLQQENERISQPHDAPPRSREQAEPAQLQEVNVARFVNGAVRLHSGTLSEPKAANSDLAAVISHFKLERERAMAERDAALQELDRIKSVQTEFEDETMSNKLAKFLQSLSSTINTLESHVEKDLDDEVRKLRSDMAQVQKDKMEAMFNAGEYLRECNKKDTILRQVKPQLIYLYQELLVPFVNCGVADSLVAGTQKHEILKLYDSLVMGPHNSQEATSSSYAGHAFDYQQFSVLNNRLTEYFADLALALKKLDIVKRPIDAPI
ncbi:hypothetical protein KL929_004483 [Ogataea haglerorum]|uniref:uncharacterized protein n=1 Tax=Ogataea haglerorum TaxID=1937702 RepID=UPI001C89F555|nr:uncharacterized protein KL911_000506 [Ogataea haglerorum]KAG7746288.1 hypothetical protein KL912_004548 [Ogataea haglerorum]KAG7759369.1 hypothetical protein KL911_000506 [Ogataea haglerorum]KAG7795018.1 hypothetical protein KL929_004483 [Ogataea haglerorum]